MPIQIYVETTYIAATGTRLSLPDGWGSKTRVGLVQVIKRIMTEDE